MQETAQAFDEQDIQGILLRGYGDLPAACYLVLTINDPPQVKRWLAHLAEELEPWKRPAGGASKESRSKAVHIAFSRSGLSKLALAPGRVRFSNEFEQGMTTSHKRRVLGDHCEQDEAGQKVDPNCTNDPEDWEWGGTQPDAPDVDVLLLLFGGPPDPADRERLGRIQKETVLSADDEAEIERLRVLSDEALRRTVEFHKMHIEKSGASIVKTLETRTLIRRKEHFGFHDGIAQPVLDGTSLAHKLRAQARGESESAATEDNIIKPGEFILGYRNEYDKLPESPTVPAAFDPGNLLPVTEDQRRDFGRNGSYLVFRQLAQDVQGFWRFLEEKPCKEGVSDPQARDRLGAAMVGRWRSGAPLALSPLKDDSRLESSDDFGYQDDEFGDKCPIGSHIRRSNPRNARSPGSSFPLTAPKVHRILRRGRAYGEPVANSMEPDDILRAEPDQTARGLHFLCFNADIGRQFEFVHHTWLNNQKFSGLYDELDPIVGAPHPRHRDGQGIFTIQATPLRRRLAGVQRHVHIRGGAYFFLPSINAVRALARMPESP